MSGTTACAIYHRPNNDSVVVSEQNDCEQIVIYVRIYTRIYVCLHVGFIHTYVSCLSLSLGPSFYCTKQCHSLYVRF